jgi:hypothetical protein
MPFKIFRFLLIIPMLFLAHVSMAQQYGFEWIKTYQPYYKFLVGKTATYRIGYAALQNAGVNISGINPKRIQLFYQGKEVPIYISGEADNIFNNNDFVEFIGFKNTGKIDEDLYDNPAWQPNSFNGLFTDTSAYFLTILPDTTVQVPLRFIQDNDYNLQPFADDYLGKMRVVVTTFTGTSYSNYDNLVVATLRSRGISTYVGDTGPVYEVTGLTGVSMVCTGVYSAVTSNPFSTFKITGTTKNSTTFDFETSLSNTATNNLSKVFGNGNFDKPKSEVPLFVEEEYTNLLYWAYNKGYVRGLSCDLIPLNSARSGSTISIGNYLEKYQTPETPWIVSEVRGNTVYELFKFKTISDGNSANREVKISLSNMSFVNGTFDVLVRDFYDTDQNPTVIEKFSQCSMNPSLNNFIGNKVGTTDGEYPLKSKFVMVEVNPDAPSDSLPCGFEGYITREYSGATYIKSPYLIYKTKYDIPGEVIFEPPFNTPVGVGYSLTSNGDNLRRTFLGVSDKIGIDIDFMDYKGGVNSGSLCSTEDFPSWTYKTKGFHMDKEASAITISSEFVTSGTPEFFVGVGTFQSEPTIQTDPYFKTFSRKFTVVPAGGFDGWDIYRESRTNTDSFILGGSSYQKWACSNPKE